MIKRGSHGSHCLVGPSKAMAFVTQLGLTVPSPLQDMLGVTFLSGSERGQTGRGQPQCLQSFLTSPWICGDWQTDLSVCVCKMHFKTVLVGEKGVIILAVNKIRVHVCV